MQKIGVVTIYYNYGSILQAYALKRFFENNNCICEFVDEDIISLKYIAKQFPSIIKKVIFSHKKTVKLKKSTPYFFNHNFIALKNNFIQLNLHPNCYNKSFLKKNIENNNYDFFFVGSDQVWSTRSGKINSFFLLDFVMPNKRNSIAPSFGNKTLNPKSYATLKSELPKFAHLSIREESGKNLIKELCDLNAHVLSDPVTLHSVDFWEDFCKDGMKTKDKYIFVHFLSQIKKEYIDLIYALARKKHLKIISFYNDANIKYLKDDVTDINGTPEDLLSLLKDADYVFTDSFHTSQFSIIFNKNFYIIPRIYKKGLSEQPRLDELVRKFSCKERIIDETFTVDKILSIQNRAFDERLNYWSNLTKSYILDIIKRTDNNKNVSINNNICINCKLCQASCPKGAINFSSNRFLYPVPIIDKSKCINCGLCLQICDSKFNMSTLTLKEGYIAFNKNDEYRNKSSSGGVFSALAMEFISSGGIVFGAKMFLDGKNSHVEMSKAETLDELLPLLKSKYVECECYSSFSNIKKYLDEGRNVLVSNTSCKIDALYKYLKKDYKNLYTIDLVCHGVPGNKFFGKYIDYLEKKYKGKVVDFSFRRGSGGFPGSCYEDFDIKKKSGKTIHYGYPYKKSMYFYLFLTTESYRESCYNCKYSTINKPANITIGDYFEAIKDYPDLVDEDTINKGVCCLIVHNSHGKELVSKYNRNLRLIPVDYKKIQLSHMQLCKPSAHSTVRYTIFDKLNKYNDFKKIKIPFYKIRFLHIIHFSLLKVCKKIIKR